MATNTAGETVGEGWHCVKCGQWVSANDYHVCRQRSPYFDPGEYRYYTQQENDHTEIIKLVDEINQRLKRIEEIVGVTRWELKE